MANYCEDYPCCGHTDGLGCDWTYTPEAKAFDQLHAFCDHEAGMCDAYDDEEPDECDPHNDFCVIDDPSDCHTCSTYWLEFHAEAAREDAELR